VYRSNCDFPQGTNQHFKKDQLQNQEKPAGSANCLTRHSSMCTGVTAQNVRYHRHAYNTNVKGMFRWIFMMRIFCGYAYFHMNHLEKLSPYWEANSQLVKDISCLLWNLMFIITFTKAWQYTPSGAWWMQSTFSCIISFSSVSILSPTDAWVLPVVFYL
jgi:hypothetical protein